MFGTNSMKPNVKHVTSIRSRWTKLTKVDPERRHARNNWREYYKKNIYEQCQYDKLITGILHVVSVINL